MNWETVGDKITFSVSLNFSKKKGGVYTQPDIPVTDVPRSIPDVLTDPQESLGTSNEDI